MARSRPMWDEKEMREEVEENRKRIDELEGYL